MTETLVVLVPVLPALVALLVAAARTPRAADRLNVVAAPLVALAALALAATAIERGGEPALRGGWWVIDGVGGVFLAVAAVVGCASALVSPAYLRGAGRSWLSARRSRAWYYAALYLFWAALLALPLAGNLALAWLLLEGTSAASALLVAFSGRRTALEAGWKYLVLTTLGLAVALLGIVVLALIQHGAGQDGLGALGWQALARAAPQLPHDATLVAVVLVLGGLAAKAGWAPVHNWLPDAHSEAPAPVSALLSAALLPAVVLVAWRLAEAVEGSAVSGAVRALLLGFGLASIVVAIPFLWRALPFKRLLAYSSLEHMGILALGIGFGTRPAIAGVLVHVAGHALAKSLGFYAAMGLLRVDPHAGTEAASGVAARSRPTAAAIAISLAALAALPPSPLFASELLILAGGVQADLPLVVAVAVLALALGVLGLLHALLEGVFGDPRGGRSRPRRERRLAVLTGALGAGLLALCATAALLPGSELVAALARGAP